ncbi:MAG: RNA-binding protein [Aestuariivita sp.]|nr:RNA-binding protein [Aestuariivita sp.]MCY4203118.1 RNA-binding protein [Aestuariivita sp.]MCY4287495.1 RNA-binding protein [Aestuariivita sp.]MCY4345859.1 RNA-binding protein [Aestuariivita sp.]
MGRGGRTKDRTKGPQRRCLVSGTSTAKSELIRFVLGPKGNVVPDIRSKLAGRGVYVTADKELLERAMQKGLFSRGFGAAVSVPTNLIENIEAALVQRVIEYISLARKSGLAVAGFEKVKAWIENYPVDVLLQASDGSLRGKSKMPVPNSGITVNALSASELGIAFRRDNVVHAALRTSTLASIVVREATKLKGLRQVDNDYR